MKLTGKRILGFKLAWTVLVLLLISVTAGWAQEEEEPLPIMAPEMALRNYSSLPALVAMVCNDASVQFEQFFAPAPVVIEPFVVLSEFSAKKRVSILSATLADQMAAVIGNESLAVWQPQQNGDLEQRVSGLLQEIDGYLRLHITAINSNGERHSYVVNIEMSEPIFRALHSYVYIP
jgi:hypothetical protein